MAAPHLLRMGQYGVWAPAKSFQISTFFQLGNPACACSSAQLSSHFRWTRHSCLQALQCFVSYQLFQGWRAPLEHTVALHFLHTFSGQGSPCQWILQHFVCSPFLQSGESLVCTARWEHEAAPCCTCWINPPVCTLCTLSFLLDLAPGGVPVDMLQHPAGCPENLDRTPTGYSDSEDP